MHCGGDRLLVGRHARHAELVEVPDGRVQADGRRDRRRARLEAPRQVVPLRAIDPDFLDHLPAAPGGLERLHHGAPPVEHADARGPEHLVAGEDVEVGPERGHVERQMRHRLGAVHQHEGARRMRPAGHLGHGVDRAEHVRHVRERRHAGARREQPVEARHVEVRAVEHRHGHEARAAVAAGHLPRDEVRVVLHLGDENLVARLQGAPDRLGHQVHALGGAAREDHFLPRGRADERPHGVARPLVQLRRLLAERVDGPVHVGVALLVVARHRLQHRRRLLAGGGGVEEDERPAIDDAPENREVGPRELRHGHGVTSLPSSAPWRTPNGQRHALHPRWADVGLEPLEKVADTESLHVLHGAADRELDQQVGRRPRDGAAIAGVARVGQSSVAQAALDADPVPAQRVHVLEHDVGGVEPAAKAEAGGTAPGSRRCRAPPQSPSSPRAALLRYGGKR